MGIYSFFVFVFVIRFLLQVFALGRIIQQGKQISTSLIFTQQPTTPFSFGSFIVVNPKQYDTEMLKQIIQHEEVHIKQWHTLDIILAEMLTIICWFNPMSWWLRQRLRLNLEYIADSAVLRSGINRKNYQYNLLKVSQPDYQVQLANNFNHSLLKNRIIMMNVKKSPFFKLWKYSLLLPLVFTLLLGLNAINAHHKTPVSPNKEQATTPELEETPAHLEMASDAEENPPEVEDLSNMTEEEPSEVEDLSDMVEENPTEVEDLSNMVEENPTEVESFEDLGATNVYVVISQSITYEELKEIKTVLAEKGIKISYALVDYMDNGLLQRIHIKARDNEGFSGYVSASFDKDQTDGKVYMYLVDNRFGIGHGNDLKSNGKVPYEIRRILNNIEGYWIGSFSVD